MIDLPVDDARVKHLAVDVIFLTDEVRSEMVTVLVFMFAKKCQLFLTVYTTTAVLSAYLKQKGRQNFISNKLTAVFSNCRESCARSKNSFFFIHQKKTLLVNCFQKQCSKVPVKLPFCEQ